MLLTLTFVSEYFKLCIILYELCSAVACILLFISFIYYSGCYTTKFSVLTSQRTSNENFTIFWRFDEEATATCTLQTPTDQLTEICNNGTFMRTRLKGGLHFLFVQGTDLAGNTGRPRRYDWIVGKCALLPGRSTSQPYQISLREFSIFNAIK